MGAKIIYSAKITKESAQKEQNTGDEIQHPWDESKGDLLVYYNSMPALNAHHARSISVKASCTVNLGLNVIEGNETAVMDRLSNVNEDGESFLEVINKVALDFETTANSYLECVKGRGGRIEELYFCPAIKTYRRPRGSKTAFLYRGDAEPVEYHRFDPNHIEDHSLIRFAQATQANRHYGLPDWRGIVPEIELDYYSNLYAQGFFLNSGIPDLAIVVEGGEFDEDTEKKVVEFVQQNFKGASNAHRTLYLPINADGVQVKFEKLAPENAWAYPIEKMRDSSRDRILSAHGVPPRLAGVVTAGQLGGGGEVEGQLSIFQEITIAPRQRLFETKINQLLRAMGINATIAFETINTSSHEKDSEKYSKLYDSGIITLDEAREAVGYGPAVEPLPTKEVEKNDNIVLLRKLEQVRRAL
ncbi:phage portal protein, HK97 family [Desulforhopalus singaporensis]|uniref:Phage portal protein, HK97 family n=2 Tax=Desulforhopalus singaporensis TaxID=91360 RepID=A0A1H0VEK8_9BACT|nr:phage portal protein, HK97 family [Desulforhopalus singaporensis]